MAFGVSEDRVREIVALQLQNQRAEIDRALEDKLRNVRPTNYQLSGTSISESDLIRKVVEAATPAILEQIQATLDMDGLVDRVYQDIDFDQIYPQVAEKLGLKLMEDYKDDILSEVASAYVESQYFDDQVIDEGVIEKISGRINVTYEQEEVEEGSET